MKVDQSQLDKWKKKGFSVVERKIFSEADKIYNPVELEKEWNKISPKKTRRAKKMNKTESSYALQLEALKQAGEIFHYGFEEVTLKLADGTRLTPDFFVVRKINNSVFEIEFHEVKGAHIWEDSKIKFKWARKQHTWFKFKMMQFKDKVWNEILPE